MGPYVTTYPNTLSTPLADLLKRPSYKRFGCGSSVRSQTTRLSLRPAPTLVPRPTRVGPVPLLDDTSHPIPPLVSPGLLRPPGPPEPSRLKEVLDPHGPVPGFVAGMHRTKREVTVRGTGTRYTTKTKRRVATDRLETLAKDETRTLKFVILLPGVGPMTPRRLRCKGHRERVRGPEAHLLEDRHFLLPLERVRRRPTSLHWVASPKADAPRSPLGSPLSFRSRQSRGPTRRRVGRPLKQGSRSA